MYGLYEGVQAEDIIFWRNILKARPELWLCPKRMCSQTEALNIRCLGLLKCQQQTFCQTLSVSR